MTRTMLQPDQSLAGRILGSVPYRDRLPAGRLIPHVGVARGDVRSLAELHLLLTPDVRSMAGVSLRGLADWVEGIIGDSELARVLRETAAGAASYVEGCLNAYELVGLRLEQARNVAGQEVST